VHHKAAYLEVPPRIIWDYDALRNMGVL